MFEVKWSFSLSNYTTIARNVRHENSLLHFKIQLLLELLFQRSISCIPLQKQSNICANINI